MESNNVHIPTIVLVDDERSVLFYSREVLRIAGLDNILMMEDSRNLLTLLSEQDVGVVVLDLHMPYLSGKDLLDKISGNYPHVPVIIMTGAHEIETAVECMKAGAFDFLVKPYNKNQFVVSVKKALEMSAMRREISSLRECSLMGQIRHEGAFDDIKTHDTRMKSIFCYMEGIAVTDQPVLVTGETGVGKDLFARAIHNLSCRKGSYVAVNIAGLDDVMFSDTLFGHKKGAFTGAAQAREGMLAKACGGTLFLDEIGDLSPASQVKLLRLLQEGEYFPLGSDVASLSRARIVVATNRNLQGLVAKGTFRNDLYFRLCAHQVNIPPLRERARDIPLLLEFYLEDAARSMKKSKPPYSSELVNIFSAYHFPGNIRELRGMIYDAMARHKGGVLSVSTFLEAIEREAPQHGKRFEQCLDPEKWLNLSHRFPTLKEIEQSLITEALQRAAGNQKAAASLLGISRQALNCRLLKKNEGRTSHKEGKPIFSFPE